MSLSDQEAIQIIQGFMRSSEMQEMELRLGDRFEVDTPEGYTLDMLCVPYPDGASTSKVIVTMRITNQSGERVWTNSTVDEWSAAMREIAKKG